jgi:hypothetical protein
MTEVVAEAERGTCICTVDVAALASLFWATGCPFCLRRFPHEYEPQLPPPSEGTPKQITLE